MFFYPLKGKKYRIFIGISIKPFKTTSRILNKVKLVPAVFWGFLYKVARNTIYIWRPHGGVVGGVEICQVFSDSIDFEQ